MLKCVRRLEEAKSLLRDVMPVAKRVLGESHELTLTMRGLYGEAIYRDPGATFADLRESLTTFEETERIARRVFGSSHPLLSRNEEDMRNARAILRARETPSRSA